MSMQGHDTNRAAMWQALTMGVVLCVLTAAAFFLFIIK